MAWRELQAQRRERERRMERERAELMLAPIKPVFKPYRRVVIAEMADWTPDTDMTNVSVSHTDKLNGSPKAGDKIARNPANHDDKWLVSAAYFAANFEEA